MQPTWRWGRRRSSLCFRCCSLGSLNTRVLQSVRSLTRGSRHVQTGHLESPPRRMNPRLWADGLVIEVSAGGTHPLPRHEDCSMRPNRASQAVDPVCRGVIREVRHARILSCRLCAYCQSGFSPSGNGGRSDEAGNDPQMLLGNALKERPAGGAGKPATLRVAWIDASQFPIGMSRGHRARGLS